MNLFELDSEWQYQKSLINMDKMYKKCIAMKNILCIFT